MKPLNKRVQVLETRQPVGCATCRSWNGIVVADSFGGRSRPDHCPDCGRVVPPQQRLKHWVVVDAVFPFSGGTTVSVGLSMTFRHRSPGNAVWAGGDIAPKDKPASARATGL